MPPFDGAEFGKEMTAIVRRYVSEATKPLLQRIETLEKEVEAARSVDLDQQISKALQAGLPSIMATVNEAVETQVRASVPSVDDVVARIPVPKDGAPGKDGEKGLDGAPGRDGIDGKDGAPGKDGEPGAPGEKGADGTPGKDGIDGKDGADGASVSLEQVLAEIQPLVETTLASDTAKIEELRGMLDGIVTEVAGIYKQLTEGFEKAAQVDDETRQSVTTLTSRLASSISNFESRASELSNKVKELESELPKATETITVKLAADMSKVNEDLEKLSLEMTKLNVVIADALKHQSEQLTQLIHLSVTGEVKKAVEEIDLKAVAALVELPVVENGKDGAPGKDGIGLAGALIDRNGELVVTLTNGDAKHLGPVVGKDGDQGKPGLDGVGFDDMDISFEEDERTLSIRANRGENVKTWNFKLSHVLDKGVYREGVTYLKGDGVSFGGSFWIAQKDTEAKPGTGDDWRLAVKKGRDGKDGKMVEPPKPVKLESV